MTMRIVFLDRETLAPTVDVRRPAFEHVWVDYETTRPEEVLERASDADVVVINKVPLRRETLERLERLKLIAVAATGTDIIDLACCRERGITVSNIRGYAVRTVPEHTFALILALRRNLLGYRDAVRQGRWHEAEQFCFHDHPIGDLHGARLGIIGEGSIGQAVAAIGGAFGMIAMFASHKGRSGQGMLYTPWDEVLATSDVITLHCPLTPETRGMIGAEEFRTMARRPLLINTARGGLIDEGALIRALDERQISGAAIDVFSEEPPPPSHPLLRLLDQRPNLIVTPHVAWASRQAQQTLAHQLIDNIEAFAAGHPENVV